MTLLRELVRSYPVRTHGQGDRGQNSVEHPLRVGPLLERIDLAILSWAQPAILDTVDPYRSVNGYGLFRSMTTKRPEIVVEVSDDGQTWTEVAFRWKPTDLQRRPRFTGPHMPRLDWQVWFAALAPQRASPWLLSLGRAILEGNEDALDLLPDDALGSEFSDGPPKYVRFLLYDYDFTDGAGRSESGAWWRRTLQGELLPRPLQASDFDQGSEP